jgi:hypothetical protein
MAGAAGTGNTSNQPPQPWSPVAIVWLGLLFTPMWAGVMAAINASRLQLQNAIWRPLVIGLGYLAIDFGVGFFTDSYLLGIAIYVGALVVLWFVVLLPQQHLILQRTQPGGMRPASWLWPGVAGAPLAFLVFWGFLIVPLPPLGPREVCARFCQASTESEARKYTTMNLWPALSTLFKLEGGGGATMHFELTDERLPPLDEEGGYLVGHRTLFREADGDHQVEGYFRLVDWEGTWKIEEMDVRVVDQRPLDRRFLLSQDYQRVLAADRAERSPARSGGSAPSTAPKSKASPGKSPDWWANKGLWRLAVPALVAIWAALQRKRCR